MLLCIFAYFVEICQFVYRLFINFLVCFTGLSVELIYTDRTLSLSRKFQNQQGKKHKFA